MYDKPLWMWVLFIGIVVVLLVVDLCVTSNREDGVNVRKSLILSALYIIIAFIFGGWIWYNLGIEESTQYITGYLIEKVLALDNIFIMSLIFNFLCIPPKYQHRVLFYGILGVIVLRAIMIALGAKLISEFEWLLYIFAAFLILTGIKMLFTMNKKVDMKNNLLLKLISKYLPVTNKLHEEKFFVTETVQIGSSNIFKKKIFITPLFVALILVEFTDLIFAIDSVPAIFAITKDPYIVYTSNIFAILGLRSLYTALVAVINRFYYLKYSLAFILIFIGGKVFVAEILQIEKFPASISLSVTFGLIIGGVLYSIYKVREA